MPEDDQKTSSQNQQPAPEDMIGERIKLKRKELDLSIEALSRLTKLCDLWGEQQGISRTVLSRYESGEFKPGARETRILCHALKVSANWLLLGADIPGRNTAVLDAFETLIEKIFETHNNPLTKSQERWIEIQHATWLKEAKTPSK